MKIAQISDTHIRPLSRHQEFKTLFEEMRMKLIDERPDHIIHTGDVFHTKRNISPEYIDIVSEWFVSLASIAPFHIVRGNHDGIIGNSNYVDAVSPIVRALKHPNIHLYDRSGVYNFAPGYNFCVYCIFDRDGWKNVEPIPGDVNIAIYHGPVNGAVTEENWELTGDFSVHDFEKYQACLLGDIHSHQFLGYRDVDVVMDEDEAHLVPGAIILGEVD